MEPTLTAAADLAPPDLHPLVIAPNPGEINREALGNLWSFAIGDEAGAMVSDADVIAMVDRMIAARERQLLARAGDAAPMWFYLWHDEQAGELRCSVVSTAHGKLPFGCPVHRVDAVAEIVSDWLASPYRHGIPMSEFVVLERSATSASDPVEDVDLLPLPIWVCRLPTSRHTETQTTASAPPERNIPSDVPVDRAPSVRSACFAISRQSCRCGHDLPFVAP